MSEDWIGHALLGVSFSFDKLVSKTTRPSCPHSKRHKQSFCPVCGKPVQNEIILDHERFYEAHRVIRESLENNWYLTDNSAHEWVKMTVLGFGVKCGQAEYERIWPLPPMEEIREKIQKILEPHDLWDVAEPTFGLYSVMIGY